MMNRRSRANHRQMIRPRMTKSPNSFEESSSKPCSLVVVLLDPKTARPSSRISLAAPNGEAVAVPGQQCVNSKRDLPRSEHLIHILCAFAPAQCPLSANLHWFIYFTPHPFKGINDEEARRTVCGHGRVFKWKDTVVIP